MTAQAKVDKIKEFAEEILTEEELLHLFETKEHPVAYDGFEPSGLAPIHFGLQRAVNIKKLLSTGVHLKLYLADYFGMINNKLGGDLQKLQTTGKYFIEVWKASGVDMDRVELIWASDLMNKPSYMERFLEISRQFSVTRGEKSVTIAGRTYKDDLPISQLMYPMLQVTDIFEMDIDICQLGMDQRRANVLAREVAHKKHWKVPTAVHHHMLLGLKGTKDGDDPEEVLIKSKMSKSDPTSAIYMHDSQTEIAEKIKGAFCPAKQTAGNPVLEYARYIILPSLDKMLVNRTTEHGGNVTYNNFDELQSDFAGGNLHPLDLKTAVARDLDTLIKPVREHFATDPVAKKLYEEVKSFQVTR